MAELSLTKVFGDLQVNLNADIRGDIKEGNVLLSDKYANKSDTIASLSTKVDKVTGKGLSENDFTDALISKLNGISALANKTEESTTNGNIKVDGSEIDVYTHPNHSGDVVSTGDGTTTIQDGVVDNVNLSNMDDRTIKGRLDTVASEPGPPQDLTPTQVRTVITDTNNRFVSDGEKSDWNAAKTHADTAHAPSDAPSNADFTSHTGDTNIHVTSTKQTQWGNAYDHSLIDGSGATTNPHGVTKTDIGLSNVENKTAAQIISEIDSTNITGTLGYIPANIAGDDFTGSLTVDGNVTITGQFAWGDTGSDNWSRFFHHTDTTSKVYGSFTSQHGYSTVIKNEQGSTNEYIFLGDTDYGSNLTIFGIGSDMSSGDNAVLDLKGSGALYLDGSRVWDASNLDPIITSAATQTISGNLTLTGELSVDSVSVTDSISTNSISVGSTSMVTNLNANYLGGKRAKDFYKPGIDIGHSGVIDGCEVSVESSSGGEIIVGSGNVYIRDYGIVNLPSSVSYSVGGADGDYYTISIVGVEDGTNSIGDVRINSDSGTYPPTDPKDVLLAKMHLDSVTNISDNDIFSCRRFTRIYSDEVNKHVNILRTDDLNRNIGSTNHGYVSIARFKEELGKGSLTISDIPTVNNIEKTVTIGSESISFSTKTVGEEGIEEIKNISPEKITTWDSAGTQKHTHYPNNFLTDLANNGIDTVNMPSEHRPLAENIMVYKNGLRQMLGVDYTVLPTDSAVQFLDPSNVDFVNDNIVIDYIL